jgi:CheY-like chemotaxis protein
MQPAAASTQKLGRRVLIVDDQIDAAQSLFLLLLDLGHDVAYALSGEEALRRAQALRPEFVFLDIALPDFDGSDVAKRLRLIPGCESALIIAVTGMGDQHRQRMLDAGCDAFYTKPLDPNLIEGLLKHSG